MKEFIISLGGLSIGGFVGLLTALIFNPIFPDRRLTAERRFKLWRNILVVSVFEVIGLGGVVVWLTEVQYGACYGIGLLLGFLFGMYLEVRRKRRFVNVARRHRGVVRVFFRDPEHLSPNDAHRLLDDLNDDDDDAGGDE